MKALGIVFLIAVSFVAVRADSVVITNGSIIGTTTGFDNPYSLNFSGSGLSVVGGGEPLVSNLNGANFSLGQMLTVNSAITGGSLFAPSTVVYNGVTHVLFFEAQITFAPFSVTLPLDANATTITAPFTITSGTLNFFSQPGHVPVFNFDVSGSGIATIHLQAFNGGFIATDITYDFVPVPEPATMFLMGAGLTGLLARKRRRRVS